MKKVYIALLAATLPAAGFAQSAIDAQQVSQSDFKGTARFMSMGGAFTALGGDITTLNQNPAGIGIYRSNEIGVTLDINMQSTKTSPSYPNFPNNSSQTKVYCNNFGYIGSTLLDGSLKSFNWGVSYNRAASFDRVYRGYIDRTNTSLSNYIAAYTTASGVNAADMEFDSQFNGYDPYLDSSTDWLSILAYNSYVINPQGGGYVGLFQNGSQGDALYNVKETGYVDEYNISFGGNVENVVYWGLSVGITDLNYTRSIYYSESIGNALIPDFVNNPNNLVSGNANVDLTSRKYINGSGWNMKFGVIVKPVNELRIGFAVHTPTWYHFTEGYDGAFDYSYDNLSMPEITGANPKTGYEYTDDAYFRWHYRAPWKMMLGVAGVIGGRAIVSADWQYDGYGNQSISTPVNYGYFEDDYEPNDVLNDDIKNYFKAANTLRFGIEYRVTPQFSVRAGYNIQLTNVTESCENGQVEVYTTGTDATYSLNKNTQNICLGLGYRYKAWYIDAAYVYTNRESTFHAFTNFNDASGWTIAPQSKLTDHNSSIVLTTGFKF